MKEKHAIIWLMHNQADLEAIAAGNAESVSEKDRGEYKKRKLVQV